MSLHENDLFLRVLLLLCLVMAAGMTWDTLRRSYRARQFRTQRSQRRASRRPAPSGK